MSSAILLAIAGMMHAAPAPARLAVTVDSSRHVVVLEYRVPAGIAAAPAHPAPADNRSHAGSHAGHDGHVERMERFRWPVSGWLRGIRIIVLGAEGDTLPQTRLHHVNLINFDRAQLVHAGFERTWGAGAETEAAMLPASIGVPLDAATSIGLIVAYVPRDLPVGSRVRLEIRWTPGNANPRPIDVLPVSVVFGYRVGATSAYDLPPGRSEQLFDFSMPLDARLLAAGGHLHDYGTELRLEERESGKVLVRLRGVRGPDGRLTGVERQLFGVRGAGKPMQRNRKYRLVVVYENPTGKPIPGGGMGTLALAMAPGSLSEWPRIDPGSPEVVIDLRRLMSFERETQEVSHSR